MKNLKLDQSYWENNYQNNQIGWDIGYVSTPIKSYFDQISNKSSKILIPGAGNGYEVEYLFNQGFKYVTVVDIAKHPLKNIQKKISDFPSKNLLHKDFFSHFGKYDYIIEQTFFCSLNPKSRLEYINKMSDLLNVGGKLVGVLFDFPLTSDGPPFGGSLGEYLSTFSKQFEIKVLNRCHNSIKPRQGSELFIIFEKKNNS